MKEEGEEKKCFKIFVVLSQLIPQSYSKMEGDKALGDVQKKEQDEEKQAGSESLTNDLLDMHPREQHMCVSCR